MNIIFDLGGVVLNWKPDDLIARTFSEPRLQKKVKESFLSHPDWIELDRGTLDVDTALKSASQRTTATYVQLKHMMEDVPAFLFPKVDTIQLIHRLKEKGHKLYVLSNMHHDSMNYLLKTHSFFTLFDGIVASCKVNMVKPEAQIYEYILKEYALEPDKTVFIDDMKENVEAASRYGIYSIHFRNPEQCEEALKEIHCL